MSLNCLLGSVGNAPSGSRSHTSIVKSWWHDWWWDFYHQVPGNPLFPCWTLLKTGFQQVSASLVDLFTLDCMYKCIYCLCGVHDPLTGSHYWGVFSPIPWIFTLPLWCVFFLSFILFCFVSPFGSPCRTPPVSLPQLVGCPSLCPRSPGSRQLKKQENSNKNCRTLRGSSDR